MSKKMTSDNHTRNEPKEVNKCVTSVTSPWLTKNQARQYLQNHIHELDKLIDSGKIRAVRRGPRTVFTRTEWLDAWMESLPSAAKVPAALVG